MPGTEPHSYLKPGTTLGKYEIKGLLGRGGMAEVYRAHNPDLNQDVAIKVLHPGFSDSEAAKRFRQEAQAVAALSHPNIIRVFDFDVTDLYFMVMELIDGPSLRQLIANPPGGLAAADALHIFKPLAEAVGYAHQHGIIHRDIKPGNVLMADGKRPVLTDFGLARVIGTDRLSATGQTSGTPTYMSPEQVAGLAVGPESDIYALGVLLYELLSGDVPFKGDSFVSIALQHMNNPPPPLPEQLIAQDARIARVIDKALAKLPEDRFPTTAAMLAALESDTATVPAIRPATAVSTARAAPPSPAATKSNEAQPKADSGAVPAQRSWLAPILVAAVAALFIVIAGLVALNAGSKTPALPAGMVYVPPATFQMGNTDGNVDEAPVHLVTVAGYFIDQTEVTNAAYFKFTQTSPPTIVPAGWIRQSLDWDITGTDGFAMGDPVNTMSYNGKIATALTDRAPHFNWPFHSGA